MIWTCENNRNRRKGDKQEAEDKDELNDLHGWVGGEDAAGKGAG